VKEKKKKIVSLLIKYLYIFHYHFSKYKVDYIELGVMQVVLIKGIIKK